MKAISAKSFLDREHDMFLFIFNNMTDGVSVDMTGITSDTVKNIVGAMSPVYAAFENDIVSDKLRPRNISPEVLDDLVTGMKGAKELVEIAKFAGATPSGLLETVLRAASQNSNMPAAYEISRVTGIPIQYTRVNLNEERGNSSRAAIVANPGYSPEPSPTTS